jgi:O-antigen/teichoic acid export membrane protein
VLEGTARRWRGPIAWGFASQGFSSATNFGLTVAAGRGLGPDGLGRVFLGFATYLIVVGLQRALLVEPLVASSSAADPAERATTTSAALRVSLAIGGGSTILVAATGVALGGSSGRGLLLIAPWLIPALAHDLWRWTLFRDRRPRSAALMDGTWAVVTALALPIGLSIGSDWAVLGSWGLGAVAGSIVGTASVRPARLRLVHAWTWWRREVWPFGRWMAASQLVATGLSNGTAFVVAAILGSAALGGLRAAESVFAPLTLVMPALALPGLPAIARAEPEGRRAQNRVAFRLSAVALAVAIAYIIAMLLGGLRLLPFLFGEAFRQYTDLLWPFAIGQACGAIGVGLSLLLKARRRGSALLIARTAGSGAELVVVAPLSAAAGVLGAAWAGASGAFAATLAYGWLVLERGRPEPKRSSMGPSLDAEQGVSSTAR